MKEQTEEICIEAVKRDGSVIRNIKNKTPKLCFYAFLNDYELKQYKYILNGIDKYQKTNPYIKNKVFCINSYPHIKNDFYYFDNKSLMHLKEYLLKENSNNKYILDDNTDVELLKEISLSNNELVIIDNGEVKDIHRILANQIIKKEDLEIESF